MRQVWIGDMERDAFGGTGRAGGFERTGGKTDGREVCARRVGGCVLRNLRVGKDSAVS